MQLLGELRNRLTAAARAITHGSPQGAAMAEYVLLAGFIAIVVMVAVSALGLAVEPLFHTVNPTI